MNFCGVIWNLLLPALLTVIFLLQRLIPELYLYILCLLVMSQIYSMKESRVITSFGPIGSKTIHSIYLLDNKVMCIFSDSTINVVELSSSHGQMYTLRGEQLSFGRVSNVSIIASFYLPSSSNVVMVVNSIGELYVYSSIPNAHVQTIGFSEETSSLSITHTSSTALRCIHANRVLDQLYMSACTPDSQYSLHAHHFSSGTNKVILSSTPTLYSHFSLYHGFLCFLSTANELMVMFLPSFLPSSWGDHLYNIQLWNLEDNEIIVQQKETDVLSTLVVMDEYIIAAYTNGRLHVG